MSDIARELLHADRNSGPGILHYEWLRGGLDEGELTRHIGEVWSASEFPEGALDDDASTSRWEWDEMFRAAGYTSDGKLAAPPETINLYRGGSTCDGMAWTTKRTTAEWFAQRWGEGVVWEHTFSGGELLARIKGRGESEYVVSADALLRMATDAPVVPPLRSEL
ncbi:Uncharacterised protein (plasmid) [Tsukamurella tyrosinosolvens]|uniref:Uncharacterized protein n=1 Tax=Tsukamurella tyrosinosolvens TaxID=57704 RepID=A0A1H4QP54_TSUTY|nr:hypothetical protein [Tsukamurella tyrosinosolvens]KXO91512.1 hypothetical protein AXK58_20155 [Tsukamurella tyrosinosolvens]SEC21426.1 hypothetical protein SAMN04489793_1808 [Tsukamurella tyrosinosolvens]VEH92539.1 Uncharacterised protein [Tsukamurella tyrosinosolvens]